PMSLIPVAPLYLGYSRSIRPLPLRLYRPCRSSLSLHCISVTPAALDRVPSRFTSHVAHPGCSIVSRLLPQHSTAKHSSHVVSPAHRPCRSPQSLHWGCCSYPKCRGTRAI